MNMQVNSIRRVIISGGGTGGHIFPAISIADALRRKYPEVDILFIGAIGRMEMSRVPEAGYRILGLPVEGFSRERIWRNVRVVKNYLISLLRARRIIKGFAPDIVIGVGGYASAPTLKAAQRLGIPTLIQEQNSYAGVTNKYLSRGAHRICVAYPEMERFFPEDKIVHTGNPIRPEIECLQVSREDARSYFGMREGNYPVVLILGGSLGAKTINESIREHLADWERSGTGLIWQTGKGYEAEAREALEGYNGEVYCSAFIDRMDCAYTLADLVVSRAGASSISELCHLGKPAILVPSPNVAEDHQTKNARALYDRGAALLIPDAEARERLSREAIALVHNTEVLAHFSSNIRALAEGNSAGKIVQELEAILGIQTS